MSGNSYDSTCPNCNGTTQCYSDHKPFDTVSGTCLDCGFYFQTKTGYSTLEEVNAERKEYTENVIDDLDDPMYPPLTELPEQKFKW